MSKCVCGGDSVGSNSTGKGILHMHKQETIKAELQQSGIVHL